MSSTCQCNVNIHFLLKINKIPLMFFFLTLKIPLMWITIEKCLRNINLDGHWWWYFFLRYWWWSSKVTGLQFFFLRFVMGLNHESQKNSGHYSLGVARCTQQHCWCTQQLTEWGVKFKLKNTHPAFTFCLLVWFFGLLLLRAASSPLQPLQCRFQAPLWPFRLRG